MNITIEKADYSHPLHRKQIVELLDAYTKDPMGGGEGLSEQTKTHLIDQLIQFGKAFSLIAYLDEQPVGLTNCIIGFSSFAAKQLVNVHDIYVDAECRGMGISHKMLNEVEKIARDMGCCKVTLEVLSNNESAKASYSKFGFKEYQLDPSSGSAQFWHKYLS